MRLLCALAALLLASPAFAEPEVEDLGGLARCIADSGATFYGAHWCPMCKQQNEWFGEHASALPYVECYDGARSSGQNDTCGDAGVRAFPTWLFADGRRASGALPPPVLAAATGCLGF